MCISHHDTKGSLSIFCKAIFWQEDKYHTVLTRSYTTQFLIFTEFQKMVCKHQRNNRMFFFVCKIHTLVTLIVTIKMLVYRSNPVILVSDLVLTITKLQMWSAYESATRLVQSSQIKLVLCFKQPATLTLPSDIPWPITTSWHPADEQDSEPQEPRK